MTETIKTETMFPMPNHVGMSDVIIEPTKRCSPTFLTRMIMTIKRFDHVCRITVLKTRKKSDEKGRALVSLQPLGGCPLRNAVSLGTDIKKLGCFVSVTIDFNRIRMTVNGKDSIDDVEERYHLESEKRYRKYITDQSSSKPFIRKIISRISKSIRKR